MLEGEDHVELMIRRIGGPPSSLDRRAGHLANREQAPGVKPHRNVHLGEELIEPRTIGGEHEARHPRPARKGDAITQLVLGDQVDHIHSEAFHAPINPPVHHVVNGAPYFRVLPVQIRLLGTEQV